MRWAWRTIATFVFAAAALAGAGTFGAAQALSQRDVRDCDNSNPSLATAPGRIKACTRLLRKVKKNKAATATIYATRAYAHFQLWNLKAGAADCDKTLKLDAGNVMCLLLRAAYYGSERQFGRAFADINKALRLNPKIAELYAVRALIHHAKGDYAAAFADAEKAIQLKPELALGYVARAGAHYEQGDRIRALADINQAIRLQPDLSSAFASRAWLYYKMGQPVRAKEDADKALSLDPRNLDALGARGCLSIAASAIETGLADLTQAIDMGSKAYDAFLCRASAYERSGMTAEAIPDYRKVLELAVAGRDSRQARAAARERLAALQSGQIAQTGPAGQPKTANIPPQQSAAIAKPPLNVQAASAAPAKTRHSPPDRRIALVIGMGAYENVQPLLNAPSDAHAVAESFRRLGFAEVSERHDLPRSQLEKELKTFGDRAENADWAVIYYAGHGIEVDGVNYLVPVDARLAKAKHVEDEALPLPRLLSKAEQARKLRLVILDACRNNPFKMTSSGGRTRSIGRGLARVEPSGGVLVAFSARDGTTADDGANGHSPFTQAFLENVEKPGLEISLLFRKIRNAVLSATNNRQEPFTYGSLPDEGLYFVKAGE
jgi:tetratricopeptide (TPR) repeat protein